MLRRPVLLQHRDAVHPDEDQAALVRDMVAGRGHAWVEFRTRYDRLILHCIGKVVPRTMGADDLREIYAKCLMRLCANDMGALRTFDPDRGTELSTWIGVVAGRCAHDHLRSLRREPARAPFDEIDEIIEDAPSPDEILERKERRAVAAAILAELPEKDREFVALYFDEGLCADEIAARMHISVKTVYSKKHKIQSRLEARLAEQDRLAA